MISEERVCLNCGKKFETTIPSKKRCSPKCTRDFHNRKRPKAPKAERKCRRCGRGFKTSKPNQTHCSRECFLLDYTPKRRIEHGQSVCPVCQKTFTRTRSDKVCCSKRCAYIRINRSKPRKTDKSYIIPYMMKNIPIPKNEMEIIYGCLLGDSGLSLQTDGFHKMSFCHCEAQLEYLRFKLNLLPSIIRDVRTEPTAYFRAPFRFNGREIGEKTQYHRESISHPSLSGIHRYFYRRGGPHVDPGLLKLLTPTSLLFWFLDDGSYSASRRAATLCTNAYSPGTALCIKKWFWKTHRVEARVNFQKTEYLGEVRNYPILRFTAKGTEKFFALLKTSPLYDSIPSCMAYKLGIIK